MAEEISIEVEKETKSLKKSWLMICLVAVSGFALIGLFFAGVKIVEQHSKTTIVAPIPTLKSNFKTETSQTADNRNTFTNSDLGFRLRYPADWPSPEVLRLPSGIEINLNNILSITTTAEFPANLSFQDYMIGEINGKIATSKTAEGTIEITIMLPNPYTAGEFLIITYLEDTETSDAVEEILSTIEFVDVLKITPTASPPSNSIENKSKPTFTPIQTSPMAPLPTATTFSIPTPDPTMFNANDSECIYGCISNDKFQ